MRSHSVKHRTQIRPEGQCQCRHTCTEEQEQYCWCPAAGQAVLCRLTQHCMLSYKSQHNVKIVCNSTRVAGDADAGSSQEPHPAAAVAQLLSAERFQALGSAVTHSTHCHATVGCNHSQYRQDAFICYRQYTVTCIGSAVTDSTHQHATVGCRYRHYTLTCTSGLSAS